MVDEGNEVLQLWCNRLFVKYYKNFQIMLSSWFGTGAGVVIWPIYDRNRAVRGSGVDSTTRRYNSFAIAGQLGCEGLKRLPDLLLMAGEPIDRSSYIFYLRL